MQQKNSADSQSSPPPASSYFFPKGYKKLSGESLARKTPYVAPPYFPAPPPIPQAELEIAELLPWSNPRVKAGIELASKHDIHTLIVGETGTGKELIAQEIHERRRKRVENAATEGPFVAVNCGAITEALSESILFGHERGAFTSARERQYGKFELAKKGTLFLDEIQSLPLQIQVKLLRVLQTGELERLGSKNPVKIECQVIAASNIPLELLIDRKLFRRDLYFRLNICPIYLPSLRDRKSEILQLTALMFKKIRARHKTPASRLSADALDLMLQHNWPGNLRELEHSLLFACLQATDEVVQADMLPENLTGALNRFIQDGNWMSV